MSRHRRSTAILVAAICLNVSTLPAADQSRGGEARQLKKATGPAPDQARIVNGLLTTHFPSVVAMIDPISGKTFCTGTLIGCETVLTAAHCVCSSTGGNCQAGGPDLADPADMLVSGQHFGFRSVSSIAVRSDFDFTQSGDAALLTLADPVDGIAPSQINVRANPVNGTPGQLAGFGLTNDGLGDTGLKRWGNGPMLATCPNGVTNAPHVCWNYTGTLGPPGEDSNTCNGDSGGPLFIADWSQSVVAGVTSGGGPTCAPDSVSFDTNTYFYRSWIQTQAGSDTTNIACGPFSQAGSRDAGIYFGEGTLNAGNPTEYWRIPVPEGTEALVVTLNGDDTPPNDVDLYVKQGDFPTTSDFDCASAFSGNPEACRFDNPTAGDWYVMVDWFSGNVLYQTTLTIFEGELLLGDGFESGSKF